jgi:hypothetical protein
MSSPTGASYVLCDHGYLREGWCRDCYRPEDPKRARLPAAAWMIILATVMTFGLTLVHRLDPAILIQLSAVAYLTFVTLLGCIVIKHEHRNRRV